MKRYFKVISKYINSNINIPQRQTKYSAGYDFEVAEDILIKPNEIVIVPTGIAAKFPHNEVLLIFPRSSLAIKKSLVLINGVGVIDSDYFNSLNEGHIQFPLLNFSKEDVLLKKGERVMQGIFITYKKVSKELLVNKARTNGFGSSDIK